MEIKIIAAAPYDGWAFILKEERLYLLKPPYRSSDLMESSARDLEKALHHYGFQAHDREFSSFYQLIQYLKQEYVKNMKELGFSDPSREELTSLLEYASDEILEEYLEKVEKELIPHRKLAAAESILIQFLYLEKVCKNDAQKNRVLALLQECRRQKGLLSDLLKKENGHVFTSLEEKYQEKDIIKVKKNIIKWGQMFPIGIPG